MCGILFLYHEHLEPAEITARGRDALDALAHRGPDEDSSTVHAGAWMGHRRLSIIDLVASRQPMFDSEDRHLLSYNGEIYNYRDLRADLAARWTFRTDGDTEVLLAGMTLDGPAFLDRAEGMWAFVLWDGQQKRLLAARDRFGKKPLYFVENERSFACSSELPALQRLLARRTWSEDLDSTADYFRYGFALPGNTAHTGVREVLPGHWLEWEPARLSRQRRFWSLDVKPFMGTQTDGARMLRDCLRKSVQRRLVADTEVGSLLSGGIDSTIVTSLAVTAMSRRMKTFSAGFTSASFDESRFARATADRLGCDHHEEILNLQDPALIKDLLSRHLGQPFADPSLIPTALVSRMASRSVKVALTGDGGDEIFCGYERYRARAILRWYTRLPARLRKAAELVLARLPEPIAHHSASVLKKAHLFLQQIRQRQCGEAYVAPELFGPDLMARLLPALALRGHPVAGTASVTSLDDIGEMMRTDALVYLPQDILQKIDRASMAYSLELRAPFLDRDLVTLAYSFPTSWHAGLKRGKRLLRKSCVDLLPGSVARRGKRGFAVPVGEWFRGALGDALTALLATDPGPLEPSVVLDLLREHRVGKRDHGLRLWAIHVYLTCRDLRLWGSA